MSDLLVRVPEHTARALHLDHEGADSELLMAAAVKLFEMERLSTGAAAELAGVCVPEFLSRLADYGVAAIDITAEELAQETRLA
ncbi:MAG: UPF0175 family protein [Armatimonadetes bacterium]|nr:UPF0175 family protein [Armatimonadota bacterium]